MEKLVVENVTDYTGKILYKKFNYGFNELQDLKLIFEDELQWQKRGLMYSASGYGKKVPTIYKLKYNNKNYRIYSCCFSNSGSVYISTKNGDIILD